MPEGAPRWTSRSSKSVNYENWKTYALDYFFRNAWALKELTHSKTFIGRVSATEDQKKEEHPADIRRMVFHLSHELNSRPAYPI